MGPPPSVCYISMLCEECSHEHDVCSLHPDSADDSCWLAARLAELGVAGKLELTAVSISNGDPLPDASLFDAVVLGGTFHGVHEGRAWQLPLREWLTEHRSTGRPLLGICGGHQAMAVALGGEVSKRPNGTQVGSVPVAVTPDGARSPLFAGLGDAPAFHFGNSDEVCLPVPPGAIVLAATADSPAVAIDYRGGWRSVQFHPEASHAIFQHWVDAGVIGEPAAGEAFRELETGRRLISNFLEEALAPVPAVQAVKL